MNGKLLAQLASVAQADAEALRDPYAWPPRPKMTAEERLKHDRLLALSRRLWYRAACKGWGSEGTDAIFGEGEGDTRVSPPS